MTGKIRFPKSRRAARALFLCVLVSGVVLTPQSPGRALESLRLSVAGPNQGLEGSLRAASAVVAVQEQGGADASAILGAALSDYRNLVEALYAEGHYSSIVSIKVDGREAADLALLNLPDEIREVVIEVDPGRAFTFGQVAVGPVPEGAAVSVPQTGQPARSTLLRETVKDTVEAWQDEGFAMARPVSESVVADHPNATLDVAVEVAPGPRVQLGELIITTPSAVLDRRIQRIAGFPSGEVYDPETLKKVATRLRRSGAFSSVRLKEAEALGPGDTLDVELSVADQKPRRFGFGAEVSSFEGLELSGFWMHRNLLGGAERLRFDAEVANIGGEGGGIDYSASARFEVPAFFGADTSAFILARYAHLDEPDFSSDSFALGVGATRIYSEELSVELGFNFEYSDSTDDLGNRSFSMLTAPAKITWDRRDDALDATSGTFLEANVMPFLGLSDTPSGVRTRLDGRVYRSFGAQEGVVLAGRLQLGSLLGPDHRDARPDDLFFSGGGGTVRGQPYQSLNVDLGGGTEIGGRSFVGASAEIRARVSDKFGAVAFVDTGYVGPESLYDGSGDWHAGAGLGVRYDTGLGPIRFDVAAPVSGSTGDGVQLYLGLGQAF